MKKILYAIVGATLISSAFAAPRAGTAADVLDRNEFIEKSRAALNRAWTDAEVEEFNTHSRLPTSIKTHLTEAQIREYASSFRVLLVAQLLAGES